MWRHHSSLLLMEGTCTQLTQTSNNLTLLFVEGLANQYGLRFADETADAGTTQT